MSNFAKQQATYLAQLQRRLRDGSITQEKYDSELWLVQQDLDSAEWAFVSEFLSEAAKNATVNLPGTISTAGGYVAAGAGAVANAAGTVAGKALSGAGKGIFSNIGLAGGGLALLAAAIWLFGWGPLSTFKLKLKGK
jgi:hypothetical protein